jgi:FeS assembly SUF system protein
MEINEEVFQLESEIVRVLKEVYDPEIPVNIYDLGLIYDIDTDIEKNVAITMTMTAPNCPMADSIIHEVRENILGLEGVKSVKIKLVFDPPWDRDMMSENAKFELGFL